MMGIINSSLTNNENDRFHNSSEISNESLCDLISQRPNINIQRTSVVRNSINLRRKTLNLVDNGNDVYLISFIFDSLYDVEITIYFCCKEGISETQEIIYNPTKYKPITKIFSQSMNQLFVNEPEEGINLKNIDINDLKCKPSYENTIPILIILRAIGVNVPQAQFNYAYIQENDGEHKYKIVLYRQKIQFGNRFFEVQEIFGIEKSNEAAIDPVSNFLSGRECVICLSEERDTAILPCRHMCLCNLCANIVRMQNTKCPICRQDVRGLLQIAIENNKVANKT